MTLVRELLHALSIHPYLSIYLDRSIDLCLSLLYRCRSLSLNSLSSFAVFVPERTARSAERRRAAAVNAAGRRRGPSHRARARDGVRELMYQMLMMCAAC